MPWWNRPHQYPRDEPNGYSLYAKAYRRHRKRRLAKDHKKAIKIALATKRNKGT
jgi:hypothetical protein